MFQTKIVWSEGKQIMIKLIFNKSCDFQNHMKIIIIFFNKIL